MAGTVSTDLVFFQGSGNQSDCESVTNWSYGAVDADNALQGTYALTYSQASAGSKDILYTCNSTNLTGKAVFFWIRVTKPSVLSAFYIYLGDGTNYSKWNVTPSSGWTCYCIKTDQTRDSGSGTVNFGAITKIGFGYTTTAKEVFYWDAFRNGTYIQIDGGTSSVPATLADIWAVEDNSANKYGILNYFQGIYFIQGILKIGSTTSGTATYFKDTSKVVVFRDARVGTSFNELRFQGNATASTEIYLGNKSGGMGISGLFIKSEGTAKFTLTVTDTNLTKYGIYGCTLYGAQAISFQAYDVNKEVLNTTFENCAEVVPSTAIIKYCNFISSPSSAITMSSTSHNITDCAFISCARAIHITVVGTFAYNNLDFSGNTYDGYNTSGSSVTVNYDQYCSPAPSTYDPAGNLITYQTSVTLTVRHVKTGNEPTEYVRCAIYKKSDMSEIMNMDATVADDQNAGYYKASQSYTVTGIVVIVRAREEGYLPFEIELTIGSGGLDVTAVWIPDPNYTP